MYDCWPSTKGLAPSLTVAEDLELVKSSQSPPLRIRPQLQYRILISRNAMGAVRRWRLANSQSRPEPFSDKTAEALRQGALTITCVILRSQPPPVASLSSVRYDPGVFPITGALPSVAVYLLCRDPFLKPCFAEDLCRASGIYSWLSLFFALCCLGGCRVVITLMGFEADDKRVSAHTDRRCCSGVIRHHLVKTRSRRPSCRPPPTG